MALFIFKTEPSTFSFDDLAAAGRSTWDGVRSAPALAHLRRARKGDEVLIYETGSRKAIVGLAQIVSDPFEDPRQAGANAKGEARMPVVDVKAVGRTPREVTLEQVRSDDRFKELPLVRQTRLSIMLVPENLAALLKEQCGLVNQETGRATRSSSAATRGRARR